MQYSFPVGCPCCLFLLGQRRPECGVSQYGNPRFYGFRLRLQGQLRSARPSVGRLLRLARCSSCHSRTGSPMGQTVLLHRSGRDERFPFSTEKRCSSCCWTHAIQSSGDWGVHSIAVIRRRLRRLSRSTYPDLCSAQCAKNRMAYRFGQKLCDRLHVR